MEEWRIVSSDEDYLYMNNYKMIDMSIRCAIIM